MADLSNVRVDFKRTGAVRHKLQAVGHAAWLGLKSAGNLVGSVGIVAIGGAVGFVGLNGVRSPDLVLVERAKEFARATATAGPTRSATSARDLYLLALAIGVALLLGGIWSLYTWWRDPLGKGKAKSTPEESMPS